jgi:tripartite-type tricarboxylate transporter receptor subunit TctC
MELGVDMFIPRFYYIGFPNGTPAYIAKKFETAIKDITQNPDYIADMEKLNVTPVFKTLTESGEYVEDATKFLRKNNQFLVDYEVRYGKL